MSVFFSVIIPLYNKSHSIERAVSSVLSQSYSNFEIIIVDDGSTDDSCNIVESIDDARVTLVKQSNQGGAGGQARNTGMKIAQGKWFAFLDADDMWFNDHLEELVKVITSYSDCKIVSSSVAEVYEGTDLSKINIGKSKLSTIDYFKASSKNIGIINCSSVSIHSSVFKDLGGFINVKSGPDLEYWARIALHYSLAISYKITGVYFRGNGGNMEMLDKQNKTTTPLESIEDISPSVAMLVRELDHIGSSNKVLSNKIRRYINSRISAVIRGKLIKGDIRTIKEVKHWFIKPCAYESLYWSLLSKLPIPTLHIYSTSRKLSKKIYINCIKNSVR